MRLAVCVAPAALAPWGCVMPKEFILALILILLALALVLFLFNLFSETTEQRAARLRAEYEARVGYLYEQAEITRAEIAVHQAQMAHDQILARVQYFRSLTKQERALLEARMRASAEAEVRAFHQLHALETENQQLSQELAALTWDGQR